MFPLSGPETHSQVPSPASPCGVELPAPPLVIAGWVLDVCVASSDPPIQVLVAILFLIKLFSAALVIVTR